MKRVMCLVAGALATAACGDNFGAIVVVCDTCAEDAVCEAAAADPCSCPAGFAGDGTRAGDGCADIDECAAGTDDCAAAVATCENTNGGFTCTCASGYTGDGTNGGTGCIAAGGDVNECADATDDCVAGAACADTAEGFTCTCAQGFAGDGTAAGTGCTAIDQCAAGTDDCGAFDCASSMGSFSCFGWIAVGPFDGFLERQTSSFLLLDRLELSSPAGTVEGITGMARDPTSGTIYVVLKVTAVSGRVLATLDPVTAVATEVGNLGDNFASLAFDATGQLWGVTGDGASVPETLYRIDKTDGTATLARALGNGTDGECIAYHPTENALYHWSGSSPVAEKIDITAPGLDITPIALTGTPGAEVMSCVFDETLDAFLVGDTAFDSRSMTATGLYSGLLFEYMRGSRGNLYMEVTPNHTVAPAVGPLAGGTPITLTGLGLDLQGPAPIVTVGDAAATDVVVVDSNTITAVTPAGVAAGPVDVFLYGTAPNPYNWPAGFTYVASLERTERAGPAKSPGARDRRRESPRRAKARWHRGRPAGR